MAWSAWRPSFRVALVAYLVYRVITELVALWAAHGTQLPHAVRSNPSALLLPWDHFDSNWFNYIAQNGYGPPAGGFQYETFAPLLPALMKGASLALHVSTLTAGLLVTNVSMVLALTALHRLVAEEFGGTVATTTVVLMLMWPTSFFLGAVYTESPAILLVACAWLAARRQRWLLVGILLALLALTKFWLLVTAGAFLYLRWERRGSWRSLLVDAVKIVGPLAVALVGWALYMQHVYGDPLAFEHGQASFGRSLAPPWQMVRHELGILVHLDFLDTPRASLSEPFDVVATVVCGAMAVWWWLRGRRRAYAVWLGLAFLVFACETALISEAREVLILFPFFVGIALVVGRRPWLERLYAAVSLPCAVFLLTRFVEVKFAG